MRWHSVSGQRTKRLGQAKNRPVANESFSTNVVLPISFGRASGVAGAPNYFLYVSDQTNNQIDIINNRRQLVGTIPTGPVPSGVTFGPDGFLYYTDTPSRRSDGTYLGRLVMVNPVSFQQTVAFGNLPFPMDVEFAPDGSFYLADFVGRQIDHYSTSNVLLDSFSDGVAMDQLAFYTPVPEPGSMSMVGATLLTAAGFVLRQFRSRSHSRKAARIARWPSSITPPGSTHLIHH